MHTMYQTFFVDEYPHNPTFPLSKATIFSPTYQNVRESKIQSRSLHVAVGEFICAQKKHTHTHLFS